MLERQQLLEIVNNLNSRYAGCQVGNIIGYRDQWFIGGYIHRDEPTEQSLRLHFCQGRNVGRINFNGGYDVVMNVTHCKTREDVFEEFSLLDRHRREEKEKAERRQKRLEARCPNCVHYLKRITGNCEPSDYCGYKRARKKRKLKEKPELLAA